ncbi:MAG TPA: ATP-binding protein [Ferroplasma sp.]|nr:ATP-binding protein [Ferroplasma sp.]
MILKETLKRVVNAQRDDLKAFEYGTTREKLEDINLDMPYAIILSGIRRCGKSTLLHQYISNIDNYYYLNFEDVRLNDFDSNDFEKLDDVFKELFKECNYYMFDEIQNIDKWEVFVRQQLDIDKKFLITGSNASLLSKELGTKLTGRHINIELFPFSFKEFLSLENLEANTESFMKYLQEGGFPEYLKYKKEEILRELFIDIIERDIVARHQLRDSKLLKNIALYLLTTTGNEFSSTQLKKTFNLGSVNTVISFIHYLEDSYLLFTIPKFDYSFKKQIMNQKKVYCIDNKLILANSASFSMDYGRLLENSVFLSIRRTYKEIFYYKGNNECDFIVKEKNNIKMAVQVTSELNVDNKKREIDGIIEAVKKFNLSTGLIITLDQEDAFEIENKKILVKPVWKWMLEMI